MHSYQKAVGVTTHKGLDDISINWNNKVILLKPQELPRGAFDPAAELEEDPPPAAEEDPSPPAEEDPRPAAGEDDPPAAGEDEAPRGLTLSEQVQDLATRKKQAAAEHGCVGGLVVGLCAR